MKTIEITNILEIVEMILYGTLLILMIGHVYIRYRVYLLKKQRLVIDNEIVRNNDLYIYRCKLIKENEKAFDKLPSYSSMLNCDIPLSDEYWIY